MQQPKTIKIFLASSIKELPEERHNISLLTEDISELFKLKDIGVTFVMCEDLGLDNVEVWNHENQKEIDKLLRECDYSFFLFKRKAGKWTRHEYDVASILQKEKRHKLFVYILQVADGDKDSSIVDFQNKLESDGVSWTICSTLSEAKYHFAVELMNHLALSLGASYDEELFELVQDSLSEQTNYPNQSDDAKLHTIIESLLERIENDKEHSLDNPLVKTVKIDNLYKKADYLADKSNFDKENYFKLLLDYADFLYDNALYNDAEIIYKRAIVMAEKLYGNNHVNTALAYNNIGMLYYNLDDYPQALTCFGKALTIRTTLLGAKHPDVATCYNNMGGIYRKQGYYTEALGCFDKALEIFEQNPSTYGLNIAETYNNKGVVYRYMSHFKEALDCHLKALPIREEILGEGHPDTAISYSNIGTTYRYLGKYDKALEYCQKALDVDLASHGLNNPYTAVEYHNIGSIYRLQENYEEALKYYNTALAIEKKVLGEEHPDTATECNNIGLLYADMHNNAKAQEYYEKAMEIYKLVLAENHPSIATLYNNMGVVYYEQGDYSKALDCFDKSLAIKKKRYVKNHVLIANTYHYIGKLYFSQKQYGKALEYLEQAYQIRHDRLGDDHPETQETMTLIMIARQLGEVRKVG